MTLREFAARAAAALPATVGGVRAAGDPERAGAHGSPCAAAAAAR